MTVKWHFHNGWITQTYSPKYGQTSRCIKKLQCWRLMVSQDQEQNLKKIYFLFLIQEPKV